MVEEADVIPVDGAPLPCLSITAPRANEGAMSVGKKALERIVDW